MKKLLALLLALSICFSLSACFGGDADVKGEVDTDYSSEEVSSEEEKVSLGTNINNTYTNKYIGVTCTLSSDWKFLTDAEIREQNKISADMLDEDIAKSLENAAVIYDMQASNNATGDTILANIEKLNAINTAIYNEEGYVDVAIPQVKQSLESMGMTVESCEKIKLDFIGKSTYGCIIKGSMNGVQIYEKMACVKKGAYMYIALAASYNADRTDDIIKNFKPIN